MIRALSILAIALPLLASGTAPTLAPLAIHALTREQELQVAANAAAAVKWQLAHPTRNWTSRLGSGSCVHAAVVNLLDWQGQHQLASQWRASHAGGSSFPSITRDMDAAGLRWAGTNSGDEAFLQWACDTRRGAGVAVQNGAHMVCLVGLDRNTATILDSNKPGQLQTQSRASFLQVWHQSGGWAITPVYTPPPPAPWRIRKEGEE